MPLILTQNEVVANPNHDWDDKEGVYYQYPSNYRNLIQSGREFIYYRGVRRADGKRRRTGEYFGSGTIGDIWQDAASEKKAWYCSIENYERFASAVPAKIDNEFIEQIKPNMWRNGVREIDNAGFSQILELSGISVSNPETISPHHSTGKRSEIILPVKLQGKYGGQGMRRQSRRTKAIGDWAELAVLEYISKPEFVATEITHRAAIGETPGWDIDYRDRKHELHRVEVKGTIAAAFSSVEFTPNELDAAYAYGENYWLALVAKCETDNHLIQLIQNPAKHIEQHNWEIVPIAYKIRFSPIREN